MGDRVAARIVRQGPQMILAGALLAFTLEASQSLLAQLADRCAHAVRGPRRGAPARNGAGRIEGHGRRAATRGAVVHHNLALRRAAARASLESKATPPHYL